MELKDSAQVFMDQKENIKNEYEKQIFDLDQAYQQTKTELEEATAQQRIVDKKRGQIVKELKSQLRRETALNKQLQVSLYALQDEISSGVAPRGELTRSVSVIELPVKNESIKDASAEAEMTVYLTKRISEIQELNFTLKQRVLI